MGDGFILKYNKGKGLICKRPKGGRALKQIEKRGGGSGQICPSPPPPDRETGEGGGASAAARFGRPERGWRPGGEGKERG